MNIKAPLLCASLAILIAAPAVSTAGVKVTLKNGRTIYSDDCRDAGSKMICTVEGGTFEIDRREIESMKDVKYSPRYSDDSGATEEPAETGGKQDGNSPKAEDSGQVSSRDDKAARGLSPEQLRRLDQITSRKRELQQNRDTLIKDREQLHQDAKNYGLIRTQAQLNEVKKRIADLDARIINFNREVDALNAEEKKIVEGK